MAISGLNNHMSANGKTVLYCHGSINPDPNGAGAARRFWANLLALESVGYNVIRVQFTDDLNSNKKNKLVLPEWKRPNSKTWFGYQRIKWLYPLFRPREYFFPQIDASVVHRLSQYIKEFKPDLIFCEHSVPLVAVSQLNISVPCIESIHDFDDILKGAKRIDYLVRNRPNDVKRSIAILREKWIAFCLRRYSFKLFRKCNKVLACSKSDYDALTSSGINSIYIPIPVFQIPAEKKRKRIEQKLKKRKQNNDFVKIVHVGGLSASHNSKGVLWFLKQCLPIIKNKVEEKKFQIHFIGSTDHASDKIIEFKGDPCIEFRGYVADLQKELTESDFAIVPPGYPTGFRTKIPEAFAYGLPVVTGSNDAYGIGLMVDDPRVIITDIPKEYAAACIRLIEDKVLRCEMGITALNTWREDYDPEIVIHDTAKWIEENANG